MRERTRCAVDLLCALTAREFTSLSTLHALHSVCRRLRAAVENDSPWPRYKAAFCETSTHPTSESDAQEMCISMQRAASVGDVVLLCVIARWLIRHHSTERVIADRVVPDWFGWPYGEECAEAWMKTVIKHDLTAPMCGVVDFVVADDCKHDSEHRKSNVIREFANRERIRRLVDPHYDGGTAHCWETRRAAMVATIARSSVVWGRADWCDAVSEFFDSLDYWDTGLMFIDPLARYHGMRAPSNPFPSVQLRDFSFRCGTFELRADQDLDPGTRFGIFSDHVLEELTHAPGLFWTPKRFPTLPHACLRLPDDVTAAEEALNPHRAKVAIRVLKTVVSSLRKPPKFCMMENMARWGTVVGQFGDVEAMLEYARTMTIVAKMCLNRETWGLVDYNRIYRLKTESCGRSAKTWFRSLAAGAFSTGRPSVVREFLESIATVAFEETQTALNYGNPREDPDELKTGRTRADESASRGSSVAGCSMDPPHAKQPRNWDRLMLSPLEDLLVFVCCDRYIPPDREDAHALAVETLCAFVDATVPLGKRRSVLSALLEPLALNCKWTMVRLLCQNVLRVKWSPFFLPMECAIYQNAHDEASVEK